MLKITKIRFYETFGEWFGPYAQMIMISNLVPYYTQIYITLTVYGGSQITHRGTIAITCSYKRESSRVSFYVTEILGPAFIGLQSSTDLKLFI